MLVVVSDLHLEEESSRNIISDDPQFESILVTRNVHPRAFKIIIGRWDQQAERAGIKNMDLVLAGDIFELHRTALWFEDPHPEVRPYTSAEDGGISTSLETKLLQILEAIDAPGSPGHEILKAFRELATTGKYVDENDQEQTFFVPPSKIKIHYFPGNHDRLANGSPRIRRKIRQLLGMGNSSARFPPHLNFDLERTLIRHGHEYDRFNFFSDQSGRLSRRGPIDYPAEDYPKPTIGDFITVDVASRLAHEFILKFGPQNILRKSELRRAYERILEFDDLRPQLAALNYLLHSATRTRTARRMWESIYGPVLVDLLDKIRNAEFLTESLKKMDKWGVDSIDLIQFTLATGAYRNVAKSYGWVSWLADLAAKTHGESLQPQQFAAKERSIMNGQNLFVIGGHTHRPAVEFIGSGGDEEQYYVNTGTWRRRIFTNQDFSAFGRVKALTYAIIYGPKEDIGGAPPKGMKKLASLDFWSGVTERWFKAE